MPPGGPVLAPVPLHPHIMTLPSPPVIVTSPDSLTPAPVDLPLPQCPCTSACPHMPQRCYKTESFPVIQTGGNIHLET
jgi:hypothetical protein